MDPDVLLNKERQILGHRVKVVAEQRRIDFA